MKKSIGIVPAVFAATILLAGCPTKPVDEAEPGAGAEDATGVGTAGLRGRGGGGDLNDPSSPLAQRIIYFEYDGVDIQPQFLEVLRAHATYLNANTSAQLRLEGHADERGTREYNLALGDRRSDAVRRFLQAEGVSDGQLTTMSYGEERSADPGHGESSWALNRRVELDY